MSNYNAQSIEVLEKLEAVRKRPGMYIGSTGKAGLHQLVWEIFHNSVDEVMAGYANFITLVLSKDGAVIVEDNGRGIPTEIHHQTKKSTLETVMTVLHAGGKFNSKTYQVSGGLHGVGASVVNALSSELEVWVKRDKKVFYQKYKFGEPVTELEVIGELDKDETGTKVRFIPDFQIMEKNDFDYEAISDRLKQTAYLIKGLKIESVREADNKNKTYYSEGGVADYVKELAKSKKPIHEQVIYAEGTVLGDKSKLHPEQAPKEIKVEVAMQYTEGYSSNIISYVNNIETKEGGTHEQGFTDCLLRLIGNYIDQNSLAKKGSDKITKEDIRNGLTAVISIKYPEPTLEGQTKNKLGNIDARRATNKVLADNLERFMAENPETAKEIARKALKSQKARLDALAAKEAAYGEKNTTESGGLPGKLADCSSKSAERSELYIVEGNSAGGSAKNGRDREIQAILPLRGKVINSEKTDIKKVFQNEEIKSLIKVLGTGIGETFNINKLRYHKIIIMTDADVDGAHIRTLLLTFLYRYFKPLIEYGFVYIAQPPLYKISQSRNIEYAYNDAEKDKVLARLGDSPKPIIQRYKGLGEMDAIQLWDTTMNPETRQMLQVQIHDAASADWAFSSLMGEDVLPRKEFIEENAKYAKDIDY